MPIFRSKDGKKTTKLYLDEIKRLHSTKDLLADLALNQPLVKGYGEAHAKLTEICMMWPIPEPRERKSKPTDPTTDAGMSDPFPEDGELDAVSTSPQSTETVGDF